MSTDIAVTADDARRTLRARWLRLHSAMIGAITMAAGFGTAKLLHAAGVGHLGLRYALVVLAAYAAFLVCVRLWIAYACWQRANDAAREAAEGAFDLVDPTTLTPARSGAVADAGAGDWLAAFGFDDLGAGLLVLGLAAAIAVVAALGLYVVWLGPELLLDAGVAWLVAAGMARRADRLTSDHWLAAVLRRTGVIAASAGAIAIALGFYLEAAHPDAHTLLEALSIMSRAP